ncbi:hypothetical protein BC835DRAFT_700005 [Cytidiella melzeri]|nr:hypothetical protein BC835DRAFT_700005 [Cytidiella melzeri]
MNAPLSACSPVASSSSPALASQEAVTQNATGSPPPYSAEPHGPAANSPFLARRSSSTPHLQSPPTPSDTLLIHPHSQSSSRRPSSSTLYNHSAPRSRVNFTREETDDETEECTSGDDAVVYRSLQPAVSGSIRERLFGKGKGRADHSERVRMISTAPGVCGAGETETEGEEADARIVNIITSDDVARLSRSMLKSPPYSHATSLRRV